MEPNIQRIYTLCN